MCELLEGYFVDGNSFPSLLILAASLVVSMIPLCQQHGSVVERDVLTHIRRWAKTLILFKKKG